MKIRIDYVTNSSSSSYCTVQIDLKDGKRLFFDGFEEYNQFSDEEETRNSFLNLRTDNDLKRILEWLGGSTSESAVRCIERIGSVQNIKSMCVKYKYTETDGDGSQRGTINYDAENNHVDIDFEYEDDIPDNNSLFDDGCELTDYDIFNVKYDNAILIRILSEHCYSSKVFSDYTELDVDGESLPCYGFSSIEEVTKTVLACLIQYDASNQHDKLENAFNTNFEAIVNGFSKLEGTACWCVDSEYAGGIGLYQGYDFNLIDGEYKAEERMCVGGW